MMAQESSFCDETFVNSEHVESLGERVSHRGMDDTVRPFATWPTRVRRALEGADITSWDHLRLLDMRALMGIKGLGRLGLDFVFAQMAAQGEAPDASSLYEASPSSWIYFVRCGEFVKIGRTANWPTERVGKLATATPYDVAVLGVMRCFRHKANAQEKEIHRMFIQDHHRREWFRLTPQILEFIETLPKVEQ